KETSNGIANLQVDLFDLDNWPDPEASPPTTLSATTSAASNGGVDVVTLYRTAERMGSIITDETGKIEFNIINKDFNLPGKKPETKPDLALVVLAPDEPGLDLGARVLHIAKDIRINAGGREGYIIRLPTELLRKHEIPLNTQQEDNTETVNTK